MFCSFWTASPSRVRLAAHHLVMSFGLAAASAAQSLLTAVGKRAVACPPVTLYVSA